MKRILLVTYIIAIPISCLLMLIVEWLPCKLDPIICKPIDGLPNYYSNPWWMYPLIFLLALKPSALIVIYCNRFHDSEGRWPWQN